MDPQDLHRGRVLQGDQRSVLDTILSFINKRVEDYYYVSPVACPTRYMHTIDDLVPLPKGPDSASCNPRILEEIGQLQPRVVIACGQSAVKSVLPKKTPQVLMSAGSMFPMDVPGMYVPYHVPVMVTNSLHTLGVLPEVEQAALWHATCQHIQSALDVAERLQALDGENNG